MAVRRANHGDLDVLVAQPRDTTSPFAFDGGAAFQIESKFAKEGDGRIEVFDDDAYVVHSFDGHVPCLRAAVTSRYRFARSGRSDFLSHRLRTPPDSGATSPWPPDRKSTR